MSTTVPSARRKRSYSRIDGPPSPTQSSLTTAAFSNEAQVSPQLSKLTPFCTCFYPVEKALGDGKVLLQFVQKDGGLIICLPSV